MSDQENPNELPETDDLPTVDETSPDYPAGFHAGTDLRACGVGACLAAGKVFDKGMSFHAGGGQHLHVVICNFIIRRPAQRVQKRSSR